MRHRILGCIVVCLSFTLIKAQNVDLYLALLERGRIQEVQDNLPELLSRYPDNPGIQYLQALVTEDGDFSLTLYKALREKYPESPYAAESALKIGEYLFARGLYSQASIQFKNFLFRYPDAKHHQRAMDLMVNAYFATGENDSAGAALKKLRQIYPGLNYEPYSIKELDTGGHAAKLVKLDPVRTAERIKASKPKSAKRIIVPRPVLKPWVVQVGAFGKYFNAQRLQKLLQVGGYQVEIHEVNSDGRRLHAVRVVRYSSRGEAQTTGRKLKGKYGLDFRVINKPE